MKGDLRLRRLHLEGRVPRSALGSVEAPAEGARVAERGIDDSEVRHAEHQLVRTHARQQVVLREDAVVGRGVDLEDVLEVRVVVGDAREHRLPSPRRDQAVRVVAPDEADRRRGHNPPRRESRRRRRDWSAGIPPLRAYSSGGSPPKIGFVFGRRIHESASAAE